MANSTPFVLFADGQADEHNRTWACTRGSALVRSPRRGWLLAFFSGMRSCADGSIGDALLMRSSGDNGTTWSAVRTLHNFSGTSGYVAPTVDLTRGVVRLFFNVNFAETWLRLSEDDGITWSAAVNRTSELGPLALGPPGGVQLADGRLALSAHDGSSNFALLSDDGVTWRRGGSVNFSATGLASGGEAQLVDDPARGAHALTMLVRVSSPQPDLNHALVQSDE